MEDPTSAPPQPDTSTASRRPILGFDWRQFVTDITPKVENRISTGHMISLGMILVAGAIAWGTSQADLKALAQRVDAGEKRDEKTSETLDSVKGNIIELKSDNKAIKSDLDRQGRQLDRIENLLRALPQAPPQPQQQRPQ